MDRQLRTVAHLTLLIAALGSIALLSAEKHRSPLNTAILIVAGAACGGLHLSLSGPEHLGHRAAVRAAILNGQGFRNDLLRRRLERSWAAPFIRDEIVNNGYLDQRNPVTIGPVLDAPEDRRRATADSGFAAAAFRVLNCSGIGSGSGSTGHSDSRLRGQARRLE